MPKYVQTTGNSRRVRLTSQRGAAIWASSGGLLPDDIGDNGDYTLDFINWALIGPKANETWVGASFRNIPTGFNFNCVNDRTGFTGSPPSNAGNPGDVTFIGYTDGSIFVWINIAGTWTHSLSWPAGSPDVGGGGGSGGDGSEGGA